MGKEVAKHFDRKVDAERFLTGIEHDKLTGAYVDPSAGRVTLRVFAVTVALRRSGRPSTAVLVETHLRKHVYPRFGDRPIANIRPSEIQAWVRDLTDKLAAARSQ